MKEFNYRTNWANIPKWFLILLLLTTHCIIIAKNDSSELPTGSSLRLDSSRYKLSNSRTREYPVPEYCVSIPPTNIITSYFDFFPGGLDNNPVRAHMIDGELQHIYFLFHQTTSTPAQRYISYAYLDDENCTMIDRVSGVTYREGYPSIFIDPVTGNPLVSYHCESNNDETWEIAFTYDLNHFINGAGYWAEPEIVIDNANNPVAANPSDEFIWPDIFISDSPVSEDHRRVYIFGKNSGNSADNINDENSCYAFADFTTNDITNLIPLNWEIHLVPQMANYVNEQGYRTFHVVNVSKEGKIYIFGYFHPEDSLAENEPETFILYNNNNFGDVTNWNAIQYNSEQHVDPPLNEDGSNTFLDNPFFSNYLSTHLGSIIDSEGKFHWLTNYTIQGHDIETGEETSLSYQTFVKKMCFNPSNNEITYSDLYPKGANPYDDNPYLPWDINEDGLVDNFTDQGEAISEISWPIYHHAPIPNAWQDVNLKMSYNESTGWMAAVWQDGSKNVMATEFDDPEYEQWQLVPEICISMSYDHGNTWTDPIFLNSINTPELANTIPEYVYPCDKLIPIDDNTMRLYLMFYDDNDFGYHGMFSLNLGGDLAYMAIDIDSTTVSNTDNPLQIKQTSLTCYPNPFLLRNNSRNKEIVIQFDIAENERGNISIYNLKGQLIKNIYNGNFHKGQNSFSWNGVRNDSKVIPEGIYFAIAETSKKRIAKKILVLY